MKILNENTQEKLPIDFITSFVAKSWDEVGILKADIDAISREFSETSTVESILQGLIDSYLIAIGQMEAYLSNKDYINIPIEDTAKAPAQEVTQEDSAQEETEKIDAPVTTEIVDDADTIEQQLSDESNAGADDFEYFVEFDEPEDDEDANDDIRSWFARQ